MDSGGMDFAWHDHPRWQDCQQAFHPDGSLRDLLVPGTTLKDWDRLLAFARQAGGRFSRDGVEAPLPGRAADVPLDRSATHLLELTAGRAALHCHFFAEEEIEFDLDPRDIATEADFDALTAFMTDLGRILAKTIRLTEESHPDLLWFAFDPSTGRWQCPA